MGAGGSCSVQWWYNDVSPAKHRVALAPIIGGTTTQREAVYLYAMEKIYNYIYIYLYVYI